MKAAGVERRSVVGWLSKINWRWLRVVKRIRVFHVEVEFDPDRLVPSAGNPSIGELATPKTGPASAAPRAPKTDGADPTFTVHGEVIRTIGKDLGIRVRNEEELREFWRVERVGTDLNWFGKGAPVVSIGRKSDYESCQPGDEAKLTFVVADRAGGKRGTRTVAFEVLSAGK